MHLTASYQLHLKSYVCALGNVNTFGPTFRAEKSQPSKHLAELWNVELEMAFADLEKLNPHDVAHAYLFNLIQSFKHVSYSIVTFLDLLRLGKEEERKERLLREFGGGELLVQFAEKLTRDLHGSRPGVPKCIGNLGPSHVHCTRDARFTGTWVYRGGTKISVSL
ncbi:hypothetical protein Syun_007908 [Stephania yunnanensis]|uniref:Aminoacyl-tRNA synthetase class II (D/K/N) domain-containing protein n=1 Tax=Stephania yunnanensis TaxID=152371 RepID=A0AAP0L108_9MAGN